MSLQEQQAFWDEFAQEYTQIQEESVTTIAEDVASFLKEQALLPVISFVDLAGGSGKYLPVFHPLCQDYYLIDFSKEMLRMASECFKEEKIKYWQIDQQAFFEQAPAASYDFIFTAMNPALQTKEDLAQLLRIAKQGVAILRLITDSDLLFSPWEKNETPDSWMNDYKNWLDVAYISKIFTYEVKEMVEWDFFAAYFEGELPNSLLERLKATYFDRSSTYLNERLITFELLLVKVSK